MAIATGVLTDTQRRTLEAVCDTFAGRVERSEDLHGLFARRASELGVAARIESLLTATSMPGDVEPLTQLLDALAGQGLSSAPLAAREQTIHAFAAASPHAKRGLRVLKLLSFLFFYALPDELGRNPNWEAIGYPGPLSAPPSPEQSPKTIPLTEVGGRAAGLEADVVVIGSGAGGSVIAAALQARGRSVLVLEQGGYRNEQDFRQLELVGMQELYLRGGLLASESGSIGLVAGSTVGGGTVVNYMSCLRTPDRIRAEWAAAGLEGIDGPEYEAHMEAIWARLGVTSDATVHNGVHRRLVDGLDALRLPHETVARNVDVACEDPKACGYCSSGCQRGCKQSAMTTFLQDAADAGARLVVNCRADRVLVSKGRATGVEATARGANGDTTILTVRAPTVVVAAGAVESPALLLRSGIGGPAAGKHLRLHPMTIVKGIYPEPVNGWIGQIQAEVSDAFEGLEGDHGFLIEAVGVAPGVFGMTLPWESAAQHKQDMLRLARYAPFLSVGRDHGAGEIVIDAFGRAVIRWDLSDEIDRRLIVRAQQELARLHEAAGAEEILTLHQRRTAWRRGEDFGVFIERLERASCQPNDIALLSAHQMGSCRMGPDPATSVADGWGQLHDVEGVWIGDASAFPSAPGVNPMISIMSLARRTAEAIALG